MRNEAFIFWSNISYTWIMILTDEGIHPEIGDIRPENERLISHAILSTSFDFFPRLALPKNMDEFRLRKSNKRSDVLTFPVQKIDGDDLQEFLSNCTSEEGISVLQQMTTEFSELVEVGVRLFERSMRPNMIV